MLIPYGRSIRNQRMGAIHCHRGDDPHAIWGLGRSGASAPLRAFGVSESVDRCVQLQ